MVAEVDEPAIAAVAAAAVRALSRSRCATDITFQPEDAASPAARVSAPLRTGRAAVHGTLYGEPRPACAWMTEAGSTFVLHDHGDETEIVCADGPRLVEQLLSIVGSA